MNMLLFILVGLAIGFVLGYVVSRWQIGQREVEQTVRCGLLENRVADLEARLKREEDHQLHLLEEKELNHRALIEAQENRHKEAMINLKHSFEQTIQTLQTSMKVATEDMLKARQDEFCDLSQKNMKGIVEPLNDTIEAMREAMEKYSKEQIAFGGSMNANMQTIIEQTNSARESALELTRALKHEAKMQGDYGEAILDELLSKQGFTKGVHYELQYIIRDDEGNPLKDEDGGKMRPDVLFHLDTVRDVIIDSKVNLSDFIQFANAEKPEEKKAFLDKHVKSILKQVNLLSQKNYAKFHKKTGARMDYVIMFVPISAAWWEALRYRPDLWREAMDKNVYVADEQTLFAALRIIKMTWTQIAQLDSQKEIFDLVNQMIDRVGQFMKHYKAIGSALASAQDAYYKAEEKLTPGGHSILTTTANLLKRGGKDSKKNPVGKYLDVDDIEQLP